MANSIKMKNKLYKGFCKEKDPHKKENYKRQFKTYLKHTVILYLHYLERQNNLITNNILGTEKNNLKLVYQTIKGIIT